MTEHGRRAANTTAAWPRDSFSVLNERIAPNFVEVRPGSFVSGRAGQLRQNAYRLLLFRPD
jgi:hypothetical protein